MKNNVLIFGAGGQLGQSLKSIVSGKNETIFNFVFLSRVQSDITNIPVLEDVFEKYRPKYVVNCAAYTQVDLAEEHQEDAYLINVTGVKNIANLCTLYNSCLIHISTDFVFEGNEFKLLNEEDVTSPINYYGLSKLQGEQEIQKLLQAYFIIRTSWLYSEFGNNFVKTMLRFAKEKENLQVVNDQVGTPTYAVDLARFIIALIEKNSEKYGVYHYSNEGLCSWYDFASSIFEYTENTIQITPVTSVVFKTKAKRPSFSVLDKTKVKNNLEIEIRHWRSSLKECLYKIK